MNAPFQTHTPTRQDWIAWSATTVVLLLVMLLHLLPALLAGCLVYELVKLLTPRLRLHALGREGPQLLAVALIATVVITALALLGVTVTSFFRNSGESVPALLQRMAEIIENSRERLPGWLLAYLPADAEELRLALGEWLRSHTGSVQVAGQELGRTLAQILIGMIIGALLSLGRAVPKRERKPLTAAISVRAARLGLAFRRVVFAQATISGLNTAFTALYLIVALPLFGVDLPFVKTLIAVTFIVGLLPILGNLISNTVIFVVSMSQSLLVALASLGFLILIHKMEYFLNANIIGSYIRARAAELLIAMLVMEAAFGIPGLIAAPIFYAYIKDELYKKKLI
ncbi:MAG TPA: AI-2E family transporter [Solimonas sp.]|nr:AI-2E family transporter [Solimonas sp.]